MTLPTLPPPPSPHLDIQNVGGKLIIFREGWRGGGGYPFAENSAKIINLIFEPFPYQYTEKLRIAGRGAKRYSGDRCNLARLSVTLPNLGFAQVTCQAEP